MFDSTFEMVFTIVAVIGFAFAVVWFALHMRSWMKKQKQAFLEGREQLVERYGLIELEDHSWKCAVEGVAVTLLNLGIPAKSRTGGVDGYTPCIQVRVPNPSGHQWIVCGEDDVPYYIRKLELPPEWEPIPWDNSALNSPLQVRSEGGTPPPFLDHVDVLKNLDGYTFVMAIAYGDQIKLWTQSPSFETAELGPFKDVDRIIRTTLALAEPERAATFLERP